MSNSRRNLRSAAPSSLPKQPPASPTPTSSPSPPDHPKPLTFSPRSPSKPLPAFTLQPPSFPTATLPHHPLSDPHHPNRKIPNYTHPLSTLRYKQSRLTSSIQTTLSSLPDPVSPIQKNALASTLIFAQEEAGTAVCIHPSGLLLTCAHCVAESETDLLPDSGDRFYWLILYTGLAVYAEVLAADFHRDLALLQVDFVEAPLAKSIDVGGAEAVTGWSNEEYENFYSLAAIPLPSRDFDAARGLKDNTPILCVGQPGPLDLESKVKGKETGYPLVAVSEGRYKGITPECVGREQDNEEVGALQHSAWTYWGHSGAPLVWLGEKRRGRRRRGNAKGKEDEEEEGRGEEGCLVGIHSSWEEETGMRRGVPWVAIRSFLENCAEGKGVLKMVTGRKRRLEDIKRELRELLEVEVGDVRDVRENTTGAEEVEVVIRGKDSGQGSDKVRRYNANRNEPGRSWKRDSPVMEQTGSSKEDAILIDD